MGRQQALLDTLAWIGAQEDAYAEALTPEDRAERGSLEGWSPRDLLGHLARWQEDLADSLRRSPPSGGASQSEDLDATNAAYYEEMRGLDLDEVLKRLRAARAAVHEAIGGLDDAALEGAGGAPGHEGRPLWRQIAGAAAVHPLLHLTTFHIERGRADQALALAEQATPYLLALDGSDLWRGVTLYNLACQYAVAGRLDPARRHLEQALALNPGLTEWSRQDPDLRALREASGA